MPDVQPGVRAFGVQAMQNYANERRRDEPDIEKGSKVYLSKYIGPYTVLETSPETSTYVLELPEQLQKRR